MTLQKSGNGLGKENMDGSFRGVADAAVMSARLRVRSRVHDALKSDCSVEALVVLCTEAGALLTGSWEE